MTGPIVPAPIVEAPLPLRRRYGIFDAAVGPLDLPAHGAGGGVRYMPDTCGSASAYGVTCYGGDTPAPEKDVDGVGEEIDTGVFVVYSALLCGAVGYRREEYTARARRRVELAEQGAVEAALWSGQDADATDLGILNLDTEAAAIPAGYDSGLITDVVGALERYAYAENGYGGPAFLHAPIEVAAFAAEAGLILSESSSPNARKLTPLGSVWVFGNYPPGEVIVTGQTAIWRSPEIAIADAFDTATNERLIVAERTYAVSFECFAGRAEYAPLEGS